MNPRHPGPKEIKLIGNKSIPQHIVVFIPEELLFGALCRTVSGCPKARYGRVCGQGNTVPAFDQRKNGVAIFIQSPETVRH